MHPHVPPHARAHPPPVPLLLSRPSVTGAWWWAQEGVGRVLKEGREGPGLPNHVGQLAFELTRYISLLDMDVRLLNASREEATRRLRLQQAQSRCRQSLQICETAHKLAAGEG